MRESWATINSESESVWSQRFSLLTVRTEGSDFDSHEAFVRDLEKRVSLTLEYMDRRPCRFRRTLNILMVLSILCAGAMGIRALMNQATGTRPNKYVPRVIDDDESTTREIKQNPLCGDLGRFSTTKHDYSGIPRDLQNIFPKLFRALWDNNYDFVVWNVTKDLENLTKTANNNISRKISTEQHAWMQRVLLSVHKDYLRYYERKTTRVSFKTGLLMLKAQSALSPKRVKRLGVKNPRTSWLGTHLGLDLESVGWPVGINRHSKKDTIYIIPHSGFYPQYRVSGGGNTVEFKTTPDARWVNYLNVHKDDEIDIRLSDRIDLENSILSWTERTPEGNQ